MYHCNVLRYMYCRCSYDNYMKTYPSLLAAIASENDTYFDILEELISKPVNLSKSKATQVEKKFIKSLLSFAP